MYWESYFIFIPFLIFLMGMVGLPTAMSVRLVHEVGSHTFLRRGKGTDCNLEGVE